MNESNDIRESKVSKKISKKISKRSQKAADKSTKTKKRRKTKDPDAPKRPLGAYFYYFKAMNTRIKEENPELIQKEVVAKIASNWKTLNEEEKQPYVEKSNQDKLRYVREKEAYDERKRKEEEDAGEEENKYNSNNRPRKGRQSSSKNQEKNGNKRPRHDPVFNVSDEKEVRLKDLLGHDQVS